MLDHIAGITCDLGSGGAKALILPRYQLFPAGLMDFVSHYYQHGRGVIVTRIPHQWTKEAQKVSILL
jgi:hypothetical protein